jgi:pimeloyl-ACP methyl ester carboxylesterase
MDNHRRITRINHDDPRSKAAFDAEQRLFSHYGLDYQVHFVEMDEPNLRLRVLEVGEGKPLLMVPGGSGDAWFFAALMAELKGYRMIALSRPGGGMSDGIDHRDVDVRTLAVRTIGTVVDKFEMDRVPIVCNSMGGLWSFWFSLDSPNRVSRMAQLGCPALILVPFINRFVAPNMQPKDINTALDMLSFQGSSQEDIDRMPKEAAEAAYHFFHLPTYLDTWKSLVSAVVKLSGPDPRYQLGAVQLQQVQCPVQFVWGDNDPFGGLDVARQAVQLIPNAVLHEMRTGHLPFMDQPKETGRVIAEFLSNGR